MTKDVLIVVDYRKLYRQELNRHKGIDLEALKEFLSKYGYKVEVVTFDWLINQAQWQNISNRIVFYTSSQDKEYRGYIDDIIYQLGQKNYLLPRYELLKAHENKLYAEILLKNHGIFSLQSWMFATVTDMRKYLDKIKYPAIVKASTGSGSISVYKADTKEKLIKLAKKICRTKGYYEYYPKYFYRKLLHKDVEQYLLDEKYHGKFVVQEFVPNLQEDWKILVFGHKFFVLNRKVRKKDFRASGSGEFSYITPPDGMLDYAEQIFTTLDVPFLSMDLCMDNQGKFYLIEFQGIHFGPYTLVHSECYYMKKDGLWNRIEEKSDLAYEYARAAVEYLQGKEE